MIELAFEDDDMKKKRKRAKKRFGEDREEEEEREQVEFPYWELTFPFRCTETRIPT